MPDLYEIDFVPTTVANNSKISPETSPHFHVFQRIQALDDEDFPDDAEEEEEQHQQQHHGGETHHSSTKGGIIEEEEEPSAASLSRSPKMGRPLGSKDNLSMNKEPLSKSSEFLEGKRFAKVDDTGLSPKLARAKFEEASKMSPDVARQVVAASGEQVPAPGATQVSSSPSMKRSHISRTDLSGSPKTSPKTAHTDVAADAHVSAPGTVNVASPSMNQPYRSRGSPKMSPKNARTEVGPASVASPPSGRPYRSRVELSLSPKASPKIAKSPDAVSTASGSPGPESPQVTTTLRNKKEVYVPPALATAARNIRRPTPNNFNSAQPKPGQVPVAPAEFLTRNKLKPTSATATGSGSSAPTTVVIESQKAPQGPILKPINLAAVPSAPKGVKVEPEWMRHMKDQKSKEKEEQKKREEAVPAWLKQLKAEKDATKKDGGATGSPAPTMQRNSGTN